MKRVFSLFALCATTLHANVVDVAPERGRPIAAINWTDETGRVRALSEFSGYPVLLLPIYTRCPGPCLQTVGQLKDALASSTADPRQFRVLLFSFDPSDNPQTLAKYRQREHIPLGWSIGMASQKDIDVLLESIGVQVGKAGTEFTHPNILIFLDGKLRIAKWIYGTNYTAGDIDRAVNIAAGSRDWIGEHSQLLYSALLFSASLLCVALCYSLAQLKSSDRSSGIDRKIVAVEIED